jgi:hypothetical protein
MYKLSHLRNEYCSFHHRSGQTAHEDWKRLIPAKMYTELGGSEKQNGYST